MRALLSVATTCPQSVMPTSTQPDPSQKNCDNNATAQYIGDATTQSDATQPISASVHALNILRALYRDSRLGEYVIPFIPEGLQIAIRGFSASLWPVS